LVYDGCDVYNFLLSSGLLVGPLSFILEKSVFLVFMICVQF